MQVATVKRSKPGRIPSTTRGRAHSSHDLGDNVPDIAVTLLVIVGFIALALGLRVLAAAEAREPARAAQPGIDAQRAMMSE